MTITPTAQRVDVALDGELDCHTVVAAVAEIDRALDRGTRRLRLDLSEVTFLDIVAARRLWEAVDAAAEDGREIELIPGERETQFALRVTGLHRLRRG